MDRQLRRILPRVQKPGRYSGGEYGQIIKDKKTIRLRVALCFPDVYEIGMSNLGLRILYGVLNSMPDVWCERVFAPWSDMEAELRRGGVPLYALESGDPLSEFDVVAFSIGYEMAYTNVLNMLDLAGIPVDSAEREGLRPLVFAGGTACCNPEPMARFMDLMAIGEGEDMDRELLTLYMTALAEDWDKPRFLKEAARLGGIYVPSLYAPSWRADGTLEALPPLEGAPEQITKRIVTDFEHSEFPVSPIVASTELAHDRVTLELFRGCARGCRFCQAGYVYRPVRGRSAERVVSQGRDSLKNTGYQEISLLSLSTSDYPPLEKLCDGLLDYCEPRSINLSLPSLRADNFSMDIMRRVQKVRRSGLTFAPEAGTQRLRDAINKNVTEEELLESCRVAFEGGWNGVKLYFMLGLPTETDEDVRGIAELTHRVLGVWRQYAKNKARGVKLTVSTSCFVPKPHTPFQWEAQIAMDEYLRRVNLLREALRSKSIHYNWHDADTSLIEAVLSRGDRRVGEVIREVWSTGGRMESWSEGFSFARWQAAFEKCGVDPLFYACRERGEDELLPWSRVSMGVLTSHLLHEKRQSRLPELSPDCRTSCAACGVTRLAGVPCADMVCSEPDAELPPPEPAPEAPAAVSGVPWPRLRLRFSKTGRAAYISHLDLMRMMQRAFSRAGESVRYSDGFNPHARISIALPLSVGMESECELMDFELLTDTDLETLPARLNAALPEGVVALAAYPVTRKCAEVKWFGIEGRFEYGAAEIKGLEEGLGRFFASDSIVISRRTKRGEGESDIKPALKNIAFSSCGGHMAVTGLVSAQEPALNPELLVSALRQLAPELAPDFASFRRVETFDKNMEIFR